MMKAAKNLFVYKTLNIPTCLKTKYNAVNDFYSTLTSSEKWQLFTYSTIGFRNKTNKTKFKRYESF